MDIIVVPHPDKAHAIELAEVIKKWLIARGHRVVDKTQPADLAIIISGDGFMMHNVDEFSPRKIPCIGINAGNRGFLTSRNIKKWEYVLRRIDQKKYFIEKRMGLELELNGKKYGPFTNDIFLRHPSSIAYFKVILDKEVLYKELYADGVIVATPTGSTGYNVAAGGTIVHPSANCLLITPICPYHLNARPIIVGKNSVLEIEFLKAAKLGSVSITADGKDIGTINAGELVVVRKHRKKMLFAVLDHKDYYESLQKKKGLMN
jgi:NAD+ kinase